MCDCNNNCKGCDDCAKPTELKYTSQIVYDGDKIDLPITGIVIEPCETVNDVIKKLAEKIEELHTP